MNQIAFTGLAVETKREKGTESEKKKLINDVLYYNIQITRIYIFICIRLYTHTGIYMHM